MGTKKSFVKGLAAGAVIAAVASLVMKMKEDTKRTQALKKTANEVMKKVLAHAKRLGKLSREAYGAIVDTTVGEYRGVKALSADELKELKRELLEKWGDVQKIMKK